MGGSMGFLTSSSSLMGPAKCCWSCRCATVIAVRRLHRMCSPGHVEFAKQNGYTRILCDAMCMFFCIAHALTMNTIACIKLTPSFLHAEGRMEGFRAVAWDVGFKCNIRIRFCSRRNEDSMPHCSHQFEGHPPALHLGFILFLNYSGIF